MAPGRRSLGLLTAGLLAGACGGPPEPLAPAPTADEADPRRALRADGPWVIAADGVAVVGGQLVARTADGALVAYAALDGRPAAPALPLDAAPVAWVPVPGGGLAIGSVTTLVRDGTTGARPAWSALTPGGQAAAAGLGGSSSAVAASWCGSTPPPGGSDGVCRSIAGRCVRSRSTARRLTR